MYLEIDGRWLSDAEIKSYVYDYRKDMQNNRRNRYFNISTLIPTGQFGLDYGCGWGAFTTVVAEKGSTVIGQDISTNQVDIYRVYGAI